MKNNCPNCGAPGGTSYCEYCGTPLYSPIDAVNDMRGKLAHIWFENDDGTVECVDVFVTRADFDRDFEYFYTFDSPYPVNSRCVQERLNLEGSLREADRDEWLRYLEKIGKIERS